MPLFPPLPSPGGHSRTHSCLGMAEALARGGGWRVVVYNRRGHGGSSLLPAGAGGAHGQAQAAGYGAEDKVSVPCSHAGRWLVAAEHSLDLRTV